MIIELLKGPLPRKKSGEPDTRWSKPFESLMKDFKNDNCRKVIQNTLLKKLHQNNKYHNIEPDPKFHECIKTLTEYALKKELERIYNATTALRSLLSKFNLNYIKHIQNAGLIRFDDIKYMLSLGTTNEEFLNLLYYRLDTQFHHILLDEFQDTSVQDWSLISPFVDEILSRSNDNKSFFCVGDKKQSIYRWRGGVSEIFNSLEKRWSSLEVSSNSLSRRCSREIISFINTIFINLKNSECFENLRKGLGDWLNDYIMHESAKNSDGYVALHSIKNAEEQDEESEEDGVEKNNILFEYTANLVRKTLEESNSIKIAILLRENKNAYKYLYFINKVNPGIKISLESKEKIIDDRLILVIISLFRFIEFPEDTIARYHIAKSPLGNIVLEYTDYSNNFLAEYLSAKLREKIYKVGLYKFLLDITAKLKPFISQNEEESIYKILDLAQSFRDTRLTKPSDFINYIQSTKKINSITDASVRIMTIHASKGLEFDCVIIPELGSDIMQRGDADKFIIHSQDPLSFPNLISLGINKDICDFDPVLQKYTDNSQQEKVKDSLSLLYVGMTRAVYALHVITMEKEKKSSSLSALIKTVLGDKLKFILGLENSDSNNNDLMYHGCGIVYETGNKDYINLLSNSRSLDTENIINKETVYINKIEFISSDNSRVLNVDNISDENNSEYLKNEKYEIFNKQRLIAQKTGVLIHSVFEHIEWLEQWDMEKSFKRLRSKYGAKQIIQDSIKLISILINKKEIHEELSLKYIQSKYQFDTYDIWLEKPFFYKADKKIYNGRFDRVMILKSNQDKISKINYACIYDYKTSKEINSDENALQLYIYKKALSKMLMLDESLIETKLIHLQI